MRSASRVCVLAGLAVLLSLARAQEPAPAGPGNVRLIVQDSALAGYRYHEAAAVWRELREGDPLQLVREPGNPHDPNAVRIEWRGHMLGYVPQRENGALAAALDRGSPLHARISRLDPHRRPSRRIAVEVFLQ